MPSRSRHFQRSALHLGCLWMSQDGSDRSEAGPSESFKSASDFGDGPGGAPAAQRPESPAFASASESGMPESPAAQRSPPESARPEPQAASDAASVPQQHASMEPAPDPPAHRCVVAKGECQKRDKPQNCLQQPRLAVISNEYK